MPAAIDRLVLRLIPRLVNGRIPDKALVRIREEHAWGDAVRTTDDGQAKGQFLASWLGSTHTFTKRILFRAANRSTDV